jgi:chromosome segregation ATPase
VSKRDRKGEPKAAGGATGVGPAGAALDDAIRRYEDAVAAAAKIPLNSQKNLERAAESLGEAAKLQELVGERLRGLADAIAATSERQVTAAELLQQRAQEVQARSSATSGLLERFDQLGKDAREINTMVLAAMPEKGDGAGPERIKNTIAGLETVEVQMGGIVERAAELGHAAETAGLVDLAKQADALRQQMLASLNKVRLVRQSFGG